MKNELIESVLEWGRSRNIIGPYGKGTLFGQLCKTQEELNETRDAALMLSITLDRRGFAPELIADLADGLGDTVVTLILACDMMGLDINKCESHPYVSIFQESDIMTQVDQAQACLSRLFWIASPEPADDSYDHCELSVGLIIAHLWHIAQIANLDLMECLAVAYEVISKRTGAMRDGVFVKEVER